MARRSLPGGLIVRLRLVQSIHRALICILDRGAEPERIGDDHGEGDRGHESDQKAVLHEVLTPLVPNEFLGELKHVIQPSREQVVRTSPFRHPWTAFPPGLWKSTPKTIGGSVAREETERW